jgi:hypothetical protein
VTYCSGASGAAREGDRISDLAAPLEPVKEGWRRIGGSLKPGVGAPRRLRALVPVLRREPRTARQPRVGQRIQPGSSILPRRRLPRALRLFAYDPSENTGLWSQVRDVNAVGGQVGDAGVEIIEPPTDKPWGLREMQMRGPDGLKIVIVEVPENHPLRRR